MFALHEYKEGVIYSKTRGTIYARLEFSLSSQDQVVYEALKEIRSMLRDNEALIRISYVQDKIADKKPPAPTTSTEEDKTFDSRLILPKYKYIIDNMIFKDEQMVKSLMVKTESTESFGKIKMGKNTLYH